MVPVWRLIQSLEKVSPASRREFLKRSVIMGTSVPLLGSLMAACGSGGAEDEPDELPDPTPTRTRAVPTTITGQATEEPGNAEEPTATAAPEAETPTETFTEATATEETGDGPRQGGVLRALGHHEISSLSPDDWEAAVHFFIVGNIHEPLLKLDPYFELQPALCESFEVSDDGLTYTFHLRDGLTFHEGEAFTSADVKYTFDFRRDPANAAVTASNFVSVDTIDTPDRLTVVVKMLRTDAAFLTKAGQTGIVSESYHSAIGEAAYKEAPNGLGPFRLVEWRAEEFTECEAFEHYWAGRPYLNGIRANIVPDASVRAIALETGEADTSIWALVTEDHIRFRDDPNFVTFVTSSLALNHFPMNNTHPVIADKAVRQAMMYAIDRDHIVNNLWQGQAVKATANLSPALAFYYEPNVRKYDYDPVMANQLLDEAGWVIGDEGVREKDGLRCAITCTVIEGDEARLPEAEIVQEYLAAVGIRMTIEEASLEDIQRGQREGTIDMSLYNWTYGGGDGEPDASTVLKTGQPNNWNLWSNDRIDELCDQGLAETDPDARRTIYSEIQRIVAEEVPFLFIQFWDWFTIFNPRIKGLPEEPLSADAILQMANTFWIEE